MVTKRSKARTRALSKRLGTSARKIQKAARAMLSRQRRAASQRGKRRLSHMSKTCR